ncbi:MAG: primosomal protein N' [Anaerolineae bacterium]|nr:primosomal protein N' [Anaerolineae bacterium]
MEFVRVVVLSPLGPGPTPTFDYHLPELLEGRVEVGSLVQVPFGPRTLYGVVVERPLAPAVEETRPVAALVDPRPVLLPAQIGLARWIAEQTLSPLHECLLMMLPPGVVGLTDTRLELTGDLPPDLRLSPLERHLVGLLRRRGPLTGAQIDRAFPRSDWRAAADRLVRRKILVRTPVLTPPRARPLQVTTVRLLPGVDETDALKGLRAPVYRAVLDFLRAEGGPVDVSWVYAQTGCTRQHLNRLYERGLVTFDLQERWRDPLEGRVFLPTEPLPLTPDQQAAWEEIRAALCSSTTCDLRPATFLLFGVTGSGKTELYLRAVGETLARGRKAIVLVPEISLTPQTVARFAARFPGRVTVLHSQMREGERYDVWRRARAGLVDVVIGPRSALFAPLDPLGLIIVDEEHDPSYKQASRPAFHAREAALELARQAGSVVILGSATPSLESYLRAQRGEFRLLVLGRRILGHQQRLSDLQTVYNVPQTRYRPLTDGPSAVRYLDLPPVHVVDMRAELRAGNRSIFSRALQRSVDEALRRGEQVILFLNRRGTATHTFCRACGYVARCPRCDVPLTFHGHAASGASGEQSHRERSEATSARPSPRGGQAGQLVCHHCGRREPMPGRCPRCGSPAIRPFGLGTAGLEEAVRERWPGARVLRWDRDTARTAQAHWNILQVFSDGGADILVGTQMIAKGLDLPLVTVVGVISADTALHLPDFRAAERTFQLLEQVAGRAGRGLMGGRVILQTYHPDHYAIAAVEHHDYLGFVQRELEFRREAGYPPYIRLARLLYRHTDARRAEVAARDLGERLRDALRRAGLPATDLIGPVPCFFARVRGYYRWQMILRHPDPPTFLRSVSIPRGWLVDVDPVDLL